MLSIMVGMVCLHLAPESDFSHFNETLNATVVDTEQMNEVRLGISGTLACLTAVIQVLKLRFTAQKAERVKVHASFTQVEVQILVFKITLVKVEVLTKLLYSSKSKSTHDYQLF